MHLNAVKCIKFSESEIFYFLVRNQLFSSTSLRTDQLSLSLNNSRKIYLRKKKFKLVLDLQSLK